MSSMLTLILPAAAVLALALIITNPSAKAVAQFAWNCFLKPIGHVGSDQKSALESFYKGQAKIYDTTRKKLLKGRHTMLSLSVSHLKKSKDIVWIDFGGGTGWNIEKMNEVVPITSFKEIHLVDLSPSLCEVAQNRFAARGWSNVHVHCIDATTFQLPNKETRADLITLSYSLSMIPSYYSMIDRICQLVHSDSIFAVVDFYVQSNATLNGKATSVGGVLLRHVNWLSRTFWRLWFEFDRVYLDSSRRDYLEYRFGTIKSLNMRNKSLGGIPYYIWIGCDKDRSQDFMYRLNALATESPYLAPSNASSDALANQEQIQIRSKGYEATVINMEHNLPYPSFYYQSEVWRIYYDAENPHYHQFNNQYIYAFTWEDPREDINLLNLGPSDVVLAITSAGDNILTYAAMENPPKRIHGVDLNPHQNHLMELKLASLRCLPFEDVWKIFGDGKHEDFMKILVTKLSPHLSSHALQFWIKNGKKYLDPKTKGLYDSGSTRWAIRIARWLFFALGLESDVKRLLKTQTIKEQLKVWNESIRPALFNPIFCKLILGNPVFLWKALGVPVNQANMIEGGILQYIVDTIDPLISRSLISDDNYFYHLCLTGSYSPKNCPDYITKKGYFNLAKRKGALDTIRLHTDTINDVSDRLAPGTLTVAIIMDHMDWFEPTGTLAVEEIQALNKSLAKGGRVMLRSSSKTPWYIKTFESQGFSCKSAATRFSGTSIDRVNMYASTWICTKLYNTAEKERSGSIKPLEL
ncbi:Ubiquinone/menaquinone biosynthesis methyltransferase ubiE [Sugiyamaella lignohabitans]|uniref:Ubiquinone/menaquinone biosynthesis methyltransferase ubiE n=1 Tax=Sugiyamaella lignohabitans TaxID=796027 RepID=A0A167BZF6_9ASCO|nr:Ubiquinone/menaquinone biosynthesis methyltransferase ubiE [Sugiyamaella lignohabitans]ANB11016.1 Ubiquinone/menaquinone biosynthesis methyltransferase ubiE [Sugiyamaella lignohabitans]